MSHCQVALLYYMPRSSNLHYAPASAACRAVQLHATEAPMTGRLFEQCCCCPCNCYWHEECYHWLLPTICSTSAYTTQYSPAAVAIHPVCLQDRASSARAKPMPATATSMVRSIWLNYFYSMDERDDAVNKQKAEEAAQQGVAQVSEQLSPFS